MIGRISGRRVPGVLPGNSEREHKPPQWTIAGAGQDSRKRKASSVLTPVRAWLDAEQETIRWRYTDGARAANSCYPCPVENCSSILSNCKTLAEHAKLQHGLKIKKDPQSKLERSEAQKHQYQVDRGKALHKCTQLGCTEKFYWPSAREHPRCPKHTLFSAEDAHKWSTYGLGPPTAAQLAKGKGRIVRLMRSRVTRGKYDPHELCRCLAVTRRAGDGAVLAIYGGHIGKTRRGPMTRAVKTKIPKFKNMAIMGQQDPTLGCHLGQYCNSQTPGRNQVNAKQIWKDELVRVGNRWELRPVCYVVAIDDAFENASEDNPIEVIVLYNSSQVNYYKSDDYDQNTGADFWDEEANKAVQAVLALAQDAPPPVKRPRR
jgi:hypothetical protein